MTYLFVTLIFLFIVFVAAGLFVVQYAMTRRDRTELFKSSTVAPSGRLKFKNSVEQGVFWFEAQPFKTVTLRSHDGLNLSGLLLSPPKPKACMVALHGFRSWPSREFAGVSKLLFDNNIAVLYPYQRSHRLSEGRYITFGVKEKYDCAKWCEFLSGEYPELPLFLYGQSMGGATVLMTGAVKMPEQLKGVIADSAYDCPADIIMDLFRRSYHLPAYPLIWFVDLWTLILCRYGVFKNKASRSMRAGLSYLFIHGDADELVPFHMGKTNFEKCPSQRKTFLTIEGAGHCACCYQQKEEYDSALLNFINDNL